MGRITQIMFVEDRSKAIFKVTNKLYYKQYLNIVSKFKSIWRLSKLETDTIPPISCLETTPSSIRNPVKFISRNTFFECIYRLDGARCKGKRYNIRSLSRRS